MNPTARIATILRAFGTRQGEQARARVLSLAPATQGTEAPSAGIGVSCTPEARLLAAIAAALFALALCLCTQAQATTGHSAPSSFGAAGSEEGQFTGGPGGLGVGTAGTVFASDPGDSRIESFSSSGVFESEFPLNPAQFTNPGALAVDSAVAGGVYVMVTNAETGVPAVAKYSATGTFEYELSTAGSKTSINGGAVTVDPSTGTVYTLATSTETFQQLVDSFNGTTGAFIASFNGEAGSPDGGFICPNALAADNAGHLFLLDACKARVDRYSSAGSWEATLDSNAPQALATNPQTGDPYVAEAGASGLQITYFSAAGASAPQTVPATSVGALAGLAVGPDATLYAGDSAGSLIDLFAAFEGPTVMSETPSAIEASSATLNGSVNPNGVAAKYHYEWGTEASYGTSTPEEEAGSGSSAVFAPAQITGLTPNTLYHFRIVGSNASGSILGEDQTFTTAAQAPSVDGSPAFATPITPTTATVHATVNPEHSFTSFRIEYGTSTAYGSSAPEGGGEVGEQSSDQAVATTLTGLQPNTLYHYRVSAENGTGGPQQGTDNTFFTAPGAPATATELTTKRATLAGTIDPHGAATTYRFEYGPSISYGAASEEKSAGSGEGEEQVSEPISGLSPGTTYHVRILATTNGITYSGADGTFTSAPAPQASVSDPTAVTSSGATFRGAANTFGLPGSFHFEVSSLDGSYLANTAEQALPAASGSQPVSFADGSLPAGQTFRVRLVLSSNEATSYSEAASFATPALPPEGLPAPPSPGSLYGCSSPHLNPYEAHPAPGATISISGSGLGLSGSVLLGEDSPTPSNWSEGGFSVEVPPDASGTIALSVNCGHLSNTIAIATTATRLPSNDFTVKKKAVKGKSATLTLELPGPGKLNASGAKIKGTSTTIAKAGSQVLKLKLSSAGLKALGKAKRRALSVKVQLRFTPTGGQAGTQTATLTFKGKRGH